jgi:hypothetical protein
VLRIGLLLSDAKERQTLSDNFYYFSDEVLAKFKMLQGFEPMTCFPGNRLEQAFLIWKQTPRHLRDALLRANGITVPDNFIQLGNITVFLD